MKKYLALSLLAASSLCLAQTNVTLYGVADTSYTKMSGSDWHLGSNHSSRVGFKGFEDLGGNLKAHFRIEKRFDLADGTNGNTGNYTYRGSPVNSSKDYTGAAYIGLSGNFGTVYLGRVEDFSREKIMALDPFVEDSVATFLYTAQYSSRQDNAIRFDSPRFGGLQVGLMYMLGKNSKANGDIPYGRKEGDSTHHKIDNDGMALGLHYENYGWTATANIERQPDSRKSFLWNAAIAYQAGPARISLIYEKTHNNGYIGGNFQSNLIDAVGTPKLDAGNAIKSTQAHWLLGLVYDTGPGNLLASIQYAKQDHVKHVDGTPVLKKLNGTATTDNADVLRYSVGYDYRLSKRTSAYVIVAYSDFDNNMAGRLFHGVERDDMWGFQIGMTHRF